MSQALNIILTGSTGTVGEGVLHVCLESPLVNSVLAVNRKPCKVVHPKLKEIVHKDFFDLSSIEEHLKGYDACLFCLGTTSSGKYKDGYYRTTYTLTMHFGETLSRLHPEMTFSYISGASADSLEKRKGRDKAKGLLQDDLKKLSFKGVFAFRPAVMRPMRGMKRPHPVYRFFDWVFPIRWGLFPIGFCSVQELAQAMIRVSVSGYKRPVIRGDDIIALAKG